LIEEAVHVLVDYAEEEATKGDATIDRRSGELYPTSNIRSKAPMPFVGSIRVVAATTLVRLGIGRTIILLVSGSTSATTGLAWSPSGLWDGQGTAVEVLYPAAAGTAGVV
jgi:hypothetical protein